MIKKRNNKKLYESIMRDVSKTVKRRLNEEENILKKYVIDITANNDQNTCITIFAEYFDYNIMKSPNSFLNFLNKYFPLINWEFDDGDDSKLTNYIQYAAYPDEYNKENYILAVWTKLNEDGSRY